MPPPTMRVSTWSARRSSTVSLVDTFEPPTTATSGRAGWARARPRVSSSAHSSGPAQATGAARASAWVVHWARWAAAKASFTYTSIQRAMRPASAASLAISPTLPRQFSSSTISPGSIRKLPRVQSPSSGTGWPSSSDRRTATGASESACVSAPSTGRPRCEVIITAAPATRQWRMPGSTARRRVSSATSPSGVIGTLRSARMNTRWPRRARSSSLRMFIALPPSWPRWCRACGWKSPIRCRTRR